MSFANDVKNELAREIAGRECCRKAELAALVVMNGTAQRDEQSCSLLVRAENAATARKIFSLIKEVFHISASVNSYNHKRFKKSRYYEVVAYLSPDDVRFLQDARVLDAECAVKHRINWSMISRACCKKAFLRGVFLSRGFINRPEGEYHLEIILQDRNLASDINRLLQRFNLQSRIVERNRNLILYIKESEKIADFLRVVGASKALLDFENARILKGMRNNVNRQVNCETANLAKTINASVRQIELIRKMVDTNGWEAIPAQWKELAAIRLDYPDLSLKELGTMLTPPLTKSGVAYRMRKLESLAEENLNNQ